MTFISLLALVAILSAEAASTEPAKFVEIVATMHQLDWGAVSAEDARGLLDLDLQRTDAEIPKDSHYYRGACSGTTYMRADSGESKLTLEFGQVKGPDGACLTRLRSISAELFVDSTAAELTKIRLINAMKAAGAIDAEGTEFQWRSDDSRMKYVLSVVAEPTDAHATSSTLWLKLRHISVAPDAVDGLPFRKGYFPPKCEAALD